MTYNKRSTFSLILFNLSFLVVCVSSFHNPSISYLQSSLKNELLQQRVTNAALQAKAAKNKKSKKKKSGVSSGGGMKGFGSVVTIKSANVETDRSKEARTFYDFMEKNGAGDNLKRCSMGFFPLPNTEATLRGVVALRDFKKGDVIIRIPYELAINLGPEGEDPTLPGLALLREYCQTMLGKSHDEDNKDYTPYYTMLPPFLGNDCLGSTDFFSDDALEALQSPLVVEETLRRRERTKQRFVTDIQNDDNFPVQSWIDGTTPISEEHLRWAVWLITSRVLTVQGDAAEGRSYRLLIPFLDMCNHDRSSPHVLTGRAVPGGELKVVAGANVKAGEQINICYGGGVAGNDRFIQDYGFLDDWSVEGYDIVAQQLTGKRRILEGTGAGKLMMEADREKTLETLSATKMDNDSALLETTTDSAIKTAIEYRLGLKKALSKYILVQ